MAEIVITFNFEGNNESDDIMNYIPSGIVISISTAIMYINIILLS